MRKKDSRRFKLTGQRMEIPSEINEMVAKAVEAGAFIVAAFRFKDGKLDLDRSSVNFPLEQFRAAVELFKQNLNEELLEKGLTLSDAAIKPHPRSSLQAKPSTP